MAKAKAKAGASRSRASDQAGDGDRQGSRGTSDQARSTKSRERQSRLSLIRWPDLILPFALSFLGDRGYHCCCIVPKV